MLSVQAAAFGVQDVVDWPKNPIEAKESYVVFGCKNQSSTGQRAGLLRCLKLWLVTLELPRNVVKEAGRTQEMYMIWCRY